MGVYVLYSFLENVSFNYNPALKRWREKIFWEKCHNFKCNSHWKKGYMPSQFKTKFLSIISPSKWEWWRDVSDKNRDHSYCLELRTNYLSSPPPLLPIPTHRFPFEAHWEKSLLKTAPLNLSWVLSIMLGPNLSVWLIPLSYDHKHWFLWIYWKQKW